MNPNNMEPRKVSIKKLIGGTEKDVNGIFHQWVVLENEDGLLDTFAIVELEDGTVEEVIFNKIKFLPQPPRVRLEWEETIVDGCYEAFVPGLNEHISIDQNHKGWIVSVDALEMQSEKLKAKTLEDAKAEAIEVIRKRISDLKKAFENIIP